MYYLFYMKFYHCKIILLHCKIQHFAMQNPSSCMVEIVQKINKSIPCNPLLLLVKRHQGWQLETKATCSLLSQRAKPVQHSHSQWPQSGTAPRATTTAKSVCLCRWESVAGSTRGWHDAWPVPGLSRPHWHNTQYDSGLTKRHTTD